MMNQQPKLSISSLLSLIKNQRAFWQCVGLLWVCWVLAISTTQAQVLTTQPAFPTADGEVTLTFDLKQAKDSRAQGLLGKTTDVYLWAWGGTNPDDRRAEFGPAGQSSFNQAYEPGKMTALGNDRWSIKLKPAAYLSVPTGKTLKWMGVLLKNGNGTNQTEDFTFLIYENKLSVSFFKPTDKQLFTEQNKAVSVLAVASQKANLQLTANGKTLLSVSDKDSLAFDVPAGQPGETVNVAIIATKGTETASDQFSFFVKPNLNIAPLPTGVKDGINYLSDSRVVLVLFAPNKSFVYALGDFNGWNIGNASLMNRTPDGNRYWIDIQNLISGKEYAYQYLVDGSIAVADPYADKLLDRNNDRFIPSAVYPNLMAFPQQAKDNFVSVLQTAQKPYEWKTKNFKRPDNQDLVIYELLVRDFVGTQSYRTLADTLPYLKKLGVNCIELMPIMEFTGNDSWGYNPIFYFAPDKAYGTKNDLKAFIDLCHQNNIAVILDMVLNQADYEFPYVKMYWDGTKPAANSPMFNQQATHPFSVFFDFNHEAQPTKDLTDRIAQYWLQEYQFDGYRFDLSKGFTQVNSGNDVGRWSSYDATRIALWKRIYDKIRSYDPTAYVILEHFADDNEERELANYGMMLWGNLNGDFRSVLKGNNTSWQRLSYRERNFGKPHLISYMESHDEERIMWDLSINGLASANYNTRSLASAAERIKAAAAFLLATPGPKMIWQFGEIGYDVSIETNGRTGRKPTKWEYLQIPERLRLYKTYAELIKLKTSQPVFRSSDFALSTSTRLKRLYINDATMKLFLVANFDIEDYTGAIGLPNTGKWYDFFTGQEVNISNTDEMALLKPGEFHIYTSTKLPTPDAGLVPWAAYTKFVISGNTPPIEARLRLYPNPSSNLVQVELRSEYRGEVHLRLHSVTGKTLHESTQTKQTHLFEHQLDLHDVQAGMYLLEVRQGNERWVEKVIK